MNPRMMKILSSLLILLFALTSNTLAEGKDRKGLGKVTEAESIMGSPSRTLFNINNISTWIYNNGESDIKPTGNSGFIYPKGSNKAAVFQSGFVWGATVDGEKRVGGSTYDSGILPGAIRGGVAEDPSAANVRIYRVRRDWNEENANFNAEIADGEGSEEEIKNQYMADWNEWPADDGAPYEDVNGDGRYDPAVDIPGFVGADQTIWFVANDYNEEVSKQLYGSKPMGVELQATFWGYRKTGAIGNIMFRKYKLINTSSSNFDSMFVSMWSDPDLGDAGDDFSGCDVALSLMYTYNGVAHDNVYSDTPPAVGFDFFQGPVIPSLGDTAIVDGKLKPDFKNLPMSVHYFFINGDDIYTDPPLGDYEGTIQFHRLFNGQITTTGAPFTDPNTGEATKFTLSGDPSTGEGWIDGQIHEPGDRRQGMVAGPFNMAAGDTQEVVIAQIVAGDFENVDRLGAVQLLKFYDLIAQNTYDNFFNVPLPVGEPIVDVTELDQEIILKWDDDDAVEKYSSNGYKFQGYVVYQLPSKAASFNDGKVVAVYDLNDGNGKIFGPDFDTESGSVLVKLLKNGSDSGIKRFISLKKDFLKSGVPLNNGTPYYFAVTSYAINPNDLSVVPTVLESAPSVLEVIPQKSRVGYSEPLVHSSDVEVTHTGTANAVVTVKVVEPLKITGDDYIVNFKQQHYYQDKDGKWKETNYPDSVGKRLAKDVSPSTLSGVAIYSPNVGTFDLKYTLDLVSPTNAWVDGIEIVLPAGITINSISPSHSNYSGYAIDFVQNGNTIFWGRKDTTQGGTHSFAGGELLEINVQAFSLPMTAHYTIYDDGYGSGDPLNPINAEGDVVITEVGYTFRTENHWNLTNSTTGDLLLDKQRVYSGIDQYASFWNVPVFVGANAAPIVDGFQVAFDGSFDPPVGIYNLDKSAATGEYKIDDYGVYGWAATGRSADAFGNGTLSLDELQKDYELRFTGVYEAPDANGVIYIKEGTGSIATLYGARGYSIADHPMNPNPGTDAPFLIRIPFEIWNIDDNRQVNLLVYDRKGDINSNPFYAFNPADRMYCEINNTEYAADVVNSGDNSNSDTDNLTWNLIFWTTDWVKGDVIKINYANPVQIGKDTFTFGTKGVMYSEDQAKIDVKKINVFPNPYYGVNPNEINKYQRYVTFNHLPPKATLRVFNLAGQLVKTVEKDDDTQFARWTLTNENELPVASGMYIVYIDMPDLGETKILKVAIIQETQILDRY